jgi:hypothetical protein
MRGSDERTPQRSRKSRRSDAQTSFISQPTRNPSMALLRLLRTSLFFFELIGLNLSDVHQSFDMMNHFHHAKNFDKSEREPKCKSSQV